MTWVLLHRELLGAARRSTQYRLRLLVAGIGVLTLGYLYLLQFPNPLTGNIALGRSAFLACFFGILHGGLTLVLGVGGALLTADCLAQERREGTLGLLLLTPLSAGELTLGKCLPPLLCLMASWLAILPLLSIPLLPGGLTPRNLVDAFLAETAAALTGVAAGLLATAFCERWGWTVFFAGFWLAAFYVTQVLVSGAGLFVYYVLIKSGSIDGYALLALPVMPLLMGIGLPLESTVGQGASAEMLQVSRRVLEMMVVWSGVLCGTVLLLVYGVLARLREARGVAPERPRSPFGLRWLAGGALIEKSREWWARPRPPRRVAGRNPYYWRESRTPGRWWMVAAVVGAGTLRAIWGKHYGWWVLLEASLPAVLMLAAVVQAAATFRQELEDGGLEVLLTTPLSPAAVLWGRGLALGHWCFPALGLSMLLVGAPWSHDRHDSGTWVYLLAVLGGGSAGIALALAGVTRRMHPIGAVIVGMGIGLVLPYAFAWLAWFVVGWALLGRTIPIGYFEWAICWIAGTLQLLLVFLGGKLAHGALRDRRFHRGLHREGSPEDNRVTGRPVAA